MLRWTAKIPKKAPWEECQRFSKPEKLPFEGFVGAPPRVLSEISLPQPVLVQPVLEPSSDGPEVLQHDAGANLHGYTLAELEALAGPEDWAEAKEDPAMVSAFALALVWQHMRAEGEHPSHYTRTVECARCGPVRLWEGLPDKVLGCPWCATTGPTDDLGAARGNGEEEDIGNAPAAGSPAMDERVNAVAGAKNPGLGRWERKISEKPYGGEPSKPTKAPAGLSNALLEASVGSSSGALSGFMSVQPELPAPASRLASLRPNNSCRCVMFLRGKFGLDKELLAGLLKLAHGRGDRSIWRLGAAVEQLG